MSDLKRMRDLKRRIFEAAQHQEWADKCREIAVKVSRKEFTQLLQILCLDHHLVEAIGHERRLEIFGICGDVFIERENRGWEAKA